jgi:hypothetical protein
VSGRGVRARLQARVDRGERHLKGERFPSAVAPTARRNADKAWSTALSCSTFPMLTVGDM